VVVTYLLVCVGCIQQDLLSEDVFLLDAYDNVYVWLGQEARQDEKTSAMDTALVSVSVCPSVCLSVCPSVCLSLCLLVASESV